MCHQDFVRFMDLFRGIAPEDPVLLVLQTTGGEADVAAKMVRTIRDKRGKFDVIVPEMAKSAGTLLALGADSILMAKQSELGPIDPQIILPTRDGAVWRPAHSVLDGFKDMIDRYKTEPSAALLTVLNSIDITTLDYAMKTVQHAQNEALKLLETYMLKNNENPHDDAASIASKLASVKEYPSHAYAISRNEAEALGLKIKKLDDDDPLLEAIWSYYCRAYICLAQSRQNALFESPRVSSGY